jgi:monovalent cation:H+ antiporter-2, CPA2 family
LSFAVEIVTDLAVLLAVASPVTFIFHRLKQPLVVGYLISGIIVGPYVLPFRVIAQPDIISVFAEIGIILLLFAIGLRKHGFMNKKQEEKGLQVPRGGLILLVLVGTLTGSPWLSWAV